MSGVVIYKRFYYLFIYRKNNNNKNKKKTVDSQLFLPFIKFSFIIFYLKKYFNEFNLFIDASGGALPLIKKFQYICLWLFNHKLILQKKEKITVLSHYINKTDYCLL